MDKYRVPVWLIARVALAVARGERRSLGLDAFKGLTSARVPWQALDLHYIPEAGAFLLVGNHYQRPGLWAGWSAMVMSVAVQQRTGRDLHWLMVSELVDFRLGGVHVPRRWLRWIFARFAQVYDFGLVSAREAGHVGGIAGLRSAARLLSAGEPLGLLPEGTASMALLEARPGVGTAIEWLAHGSRPIVPVGVAEQDGVLTASFGPHVDLEEVAGSKAERDRLISERVMGAIAGLLPEDLRGRYTT